MKRKRESRKRESLYHQINNLSEQYFEEQKKTPKQLLKKTSAYLVRLHKKKKLEELRSIGNYAPLQGILCAQIFFRNLCNIQYSLLLINIRDL